jgi:hypothetical protein
VLSYRCKDRCSSHFQKPIRGYLRLPLCCFFGTLYVICMRNAWSGNLRRPLERKMMSVLLSVYRTRLTYCSKCTNVAFLLQNIFRNEIDNIRTRLAYCTYGKMICCEIRYSHSTEHRAGKAVRLASWRKMTQPGEFCW